MNKTPLNILIIPHQPHRNIKVRALEMAKCLANFSHFNVFVLTWELSPAPAKNPVIRVINKLKECITTAKTEFSTESNGDFQWIRMPHLLAPYPICKQFNETQLNNIVDKLDINVVINANAYHFPTPNNKNLFKVYDVVDDHMSPDSGPVWQKTKEVTLAELKKADHIISITHALQQVIKKAGYKNSTRIANGVDLENFQIIPEAQIEAIRKKYNLHNKKVIAYIGNHGWWAGMKFMLESFEKLRKERPDTALMIVGPGHDIAEFEPLYENEHIIFTGSVPPSEVAAYFHMSEFGVLPFDLCPFTHHALPLKVLEYGAAKKKVFSSELEELVHLKFPHIDLLPLNQEYWVKAMKKELDNPTEWKPEWTSVIHQYDWKSLFQPLVQLIESTSEDSVDE